MKGNQDNQALRKINNYHDRACIHSNKDKNLIKKKKIFF